MLKHEALTAGASVPTEALSDFVDRAEERALRVRGEPVVEAVVARNAPVELLRALERVSAGLADQAARHRRVAQRAAGRLGCLLHLGADACEVLRRSEGRVVLVREAGGGLGSTARSL